MKQVLHRLTKKPLFWMMVSVVCVIALIISISVSQHQTKYISQPLALPEVDNEPFSSKAEIEEDTGWKTIIARKGDTLGRIFKREGLSQRTLAAILHANPYAKSITTIKPNQSIQIYVHDDVLEKMIFNHNATQLLVVTLKNDHYVSTIKSRTMDTHEEYATATVRGSLYSTAARTKIPAKLIRQMIDIFHWELDFSKDIRAGDQFTILYQAQYIDDKLVNTGDILAVTYTSKDHQYQAIRYPLPEGGYDYYTPEGHSLKKAFSRYPLQFTHISSTFSLSRQHPILHYYRPHKGVDLAAPIGTPIRATGDGRVVQIGRQNAYGNMIKIEHSNMYASLYGHLLRFQKGLSRGMRVKRGQIIGYVG
ncbi:MAG TPA: peptidoglycan DD-metalloendopeptidase family protein, partial [Legionellaceae bacterium]|nr:peptidoglycan DD-metalloendopeptidase family protein [Legionellaceae bacterium]